jgi:hypothetical protein
MSTVATWAKKLEGLSAAVALKQTAVTYTFFGDWVYHFQEKLRSDANHRIILFD